MQSKKGFIVTAIVLAAITAGSFTVWMIPQGTQTKFVISNAGDELDALIEQQKAIADSDKIEFDRLISGHITADNYINIAEVSSSQINSLIIKIVESDVPVEWRQSYSAFSDSLRSYNLYLRETIVIAEKIKSEQMLDMKQESVKLEEFLKHADEYTASSNDTRP